MATSLGAKLAIGILVVIVIVLIIAYVNSEKIAGKYKVVGVSGPVSGEVTIVGGVGADGSKSYLLKTDVNVANKLPAYYLGSFQVTGFDLFKSQADVANPVAVPVGRLEMNVITGDLSLVIGTQVLKLLREIVPVSAGSTGTTGTTETSSGSTGSDGSFLTNIVDTVSSAIESGPKYLGCFQDQSVRALSKYTGDKTFDECALDAKNGGYKYFGTQFAEGIGGGKAQCFVGNSGYDRYGKISGCAPLAPITQVVGRAGSNAVYETPQ